MLQTIFIQLLKTYTADEKLIQTFWLILQRQYTAKGRHYHTWMHLENMYALLLPLKDTIEDWNTLLFSLFYHDIIYSAMAKDNEEQSAVVAEKCLHQIQYPVERIELCKQQILATKNHTVSSNADSNYFTDADLSILGTDRAAYESYTKAIRKEYAIYPDLLYKPGRRKVLQHFLSMESIYKTDHFYHLYEAAARQNMQKELVLLQ